MAINYELLNKGGISLGTNFELLSEKPLDSRLVVPSLAGLQNYIDNAAAYEGMIVYVTSENKHYEVKTIEGVLSYRQFGLTTEELNEIIANATTAAMEFKGATATLPENPAKGDMYKVAGENINITIDGVAAKVGDSIVYDGAKWFLIPSGDDIEDTWRPVDGVNNDATLKFVNGDKTVAAVAADGTIKYNHATVAAPELLAENEQTRTYITEVETDGYGHITGYKTATENVVDTNTEYTFESQVETSSVYFNVTPNTEGATEETIYVDAYSKNEADGKFVAKEGYIAYTQDEKDKLAGLSNYDDEELRGLIGGNAQNLENLEEYVGTIPTNYTETNVIAYINKKAEETLAAAQGGSSETAASVKQQLDNYKSENDTRVKAAEDAIDAIEADYLKGADKTELANAIAGVKTTADAAATKKYVDETFVVKETGKSLVADSEITKLSGVSAGANKVEASANNGRIKIDGVETVVYTHPNKHAIADVEGLQAALDGLQPKGEYAAKEHTHTKSEITDFAHTHTASDITDFAAEVAKVKVNEATKADSAAKVENALTVKVGGADVVFDGSAAKTADVDAAIEAAINAIPEQTNYAVSIEEDTTDSTIAKRYIFKQLGAEIGRIDLAKELVVTSGTVKEVTINDMPYAGAKIGDKYIELVIANQTAPIYIPAKDLVDIYTAKSGAAEVQVAISNTNEISATLVNGGIAEEKLAEAVKTKLNKAWEEVGVAQGLVNDLANGQVKTNKEAIENITKADGLIATAKAEAIAAAKSDAANLDAVVLSEAQKYTDAAEDRLEALLTWGSF